jgi:hypothetical protein
MIEKRESRVLSPEVVYVPQEAIDKFGIELLKVINNASIIKPLESLGEESDE